VIPSHGNFADPKTLTLRPIKQLDIEREAIDPSRFKNRSGRIEAKGFESALGVPKSETGGESHK
jgi:hypothetical protein